MVFTMATEQEISNTEYESNDKSTEAFDGCYYSGSMYPHNTSIYCLNTSFRCYDGAWSAEGSTPGSNDIQVNCKVNSPDPGTTSENIGDRNADGEYCYYNNQQYSKGARVCLDGTLYICDFDRWGASGSC